MLATSLRVGVALLFAVAIGLGAVVVLAGYPVSGVCIAIAVLFSYAIILALELVCLFLVDDSSTAPKPLDLLQAWLAETSRTPRVFWWSQPFRSSAHPDHLPADANGRRGILLVHGLVCNRGFWNPWMARLRHLGIPFVAVNLEPIFGPIEGNADSIDSAIARLESTTGTPPVIVAHSMGGLAVRYWFTRQQGQAPRVHRILTIGTPHQGTWTARFARAKNGRQMAIGSEWLETLAAATMPSHAANFTCFYSSSDNLVFPSARAQLPGAAKQHVPRTGHVSLAFKNEVFQEVLRWVCQDVDRSDSPAGKDLPGGTSSSCETWR